MLLRLVRAPGEAADGHRSPSVVRTLSQREGPATAGGSMHVLRMRTHPPLQGRPDFQVREPIGWGAAGGGGSALRTLSASGSEGEELSRLLARVSDDRTRRSSRA